jgi:hypothetical protein
MDTTYRVIDLADRENVCQTAATPNLAKLAVGRMWRDPKSRFALEQTDWGEEYGKPKAHRSVVIEAEDSANPWKIGQ